MKALFWIATSNFVFPALFNIVLIVTTTSVKINENTILLMVIHQSDIYIEIIGVLFATVWVANARANIISSSASSDTQTSSMRFVPNPTLATNRSHRSSKIVTMVPVALERAESTPTDEISALQRPKSSVY
ncbi:MAG TPA: hypothetical protein VGO47_00065 [Chlamydiales bacterium]|nr:hypothetical protein [Chlamydiales bacterium]